MPLPAVGKKKKRDVCVKVRPNSTLFPSYLAQNDWYSDCQEGTIQLLRRPSVILSDDHPSTQQYISIQWQHLLNSGEHLHSMAIFIK